MPAHPTAAAPSTDGRPSPGALLRAADPTRRIGLLIGGVVVLALVLRLPTAGEQSFWLDEVYTGRIVDGSLGHAWSTIQRTENTPPLFYLLDWVVGRLLGTGELALRSLSAVAGALAVVPVVVLARAVAGGRDDPGAAPSADLPADDAVGAPAGGPLARATAALDAAVRRGAAAEHRAVPVLVALGAGVLMAVNPLAQWFGQEARSYGLFLLLSGVAWVALLRACARPDTRRLWAWALAATAVSWTHYFGGLLFLVGWVAIAGVLVARVPVGGRRVPALRPAAVPALASVVGLLALVPIAVNQQSTDMYQAIANVKGVGARILETPKQFAVGYNAPAEYVVGFVLVAILAVLVIAAAWPRDGRPTRATALLGLVAVIWVLPLIALIGGFDVVLTRNFVLLIPPLVVLAALGAWRLGRRAVVLLGVVAVVQAAVVVVVAVTPIDQREDWRGVMRAVTRGVPGPEMVLFRGYQGPAATYYAPTLRQQPGATPATVRSIAIVDRSEGGKELSRITPPTASSEYRLLRVEQRAQWRVFVWRAVTPQSVRPSDVGAMTPDVTRVGLLLP